MLKASCAEQPNFFKAAGIKMDSTLCSMEITSFVVVKVKARKINWEIILSRLEKVCCFFLGRKEALFFVWP